MGIVMLPCTLYRTVGSSHYDMGHFEDLVLQETLYQRDDTLLYITYVMLIWAAPIPADRWHCSLWP